MASHIAWRDYIWDRNANLVLDPYAQPHLTLKPSRYIKKVVKYLFKIKKTDEELVVVGESEKSLDRLLEVCDPKDIILCGGIVINHHLQKNSLTIPAVIGQGDIDMKVMDLKTLRKILKAAQKDFHVSHYHDYAKKKGDYIHIDRFFGGLV
ncbi:hypothetical protein ACFL15_01885, partial [Patescibacteria group bacterium]